MKRSLLYLLLIPILFSTAQAQQWQDFTSQSRVKNMHIDGDMVYLATLGGMVRYNLATGQHQLYTKANSGLASNAVEVIKTEDAGTIWIGTYDAGVTTFDGNTWTTYNTKNSPLPGNVILTLAIDRQNNKWIGTNKGLVKISDNGWTIYNSMTSPMEDDDVWAMDIDKDGGLWIGCVTGSYLLRDDQWTDFSSQVPMYGVNGMACMPDGEVFNCGVGGVFLYKSGVWTDISAGGPAGLRNARKALRAPDGNIWVATDYNGVYRFDGMQWTGGTGSIVSQLNDNGTLALDASGSLYTAGAKGISRNTGGGWEQLYKPATGLYENYVRSIAADMQGKLWVAHNHAIASYDGTHWAHYTHENSSLPHGIIYRIRNQEPGIIWVCTSAGLVRIERNKWETFTKSNAGFATNEILDVAFDKTGIVWVSHDNGLSSFDGTKWKHLGRPAGYAPYERGIVIITDEAGTVWMGSNLGKVVSYAGGAWKYYTAEEKTFPGGYVMDFTVDKTGKLWAAVWGNNICYFDGETWTALADSNNVSAASLVAGENGKLWVASSYPATLTSYQDLTQVNLFNTTNSPISGRTIYSLAEDENGNIWIGTSYGLVMYGGDNHTGIPAFEKDLMDFSLYPNPGRDITRISFQAPGAGKISTKIFDMTGKLLASDSHTIPSGLNTIELSVSALAPGSYILEVSHGGAAARKQLVVAP